MTAVLATVGSLSRAAGLHWDGSDTTATPTGEPEPGIRPISTGTHPRSEAQIPPGAIATRTPPSLEERGEPLRHHHRRLERRDHCKPGVNPLHLWNGVEPQPAQHLWNHAERGRHRLHVSGQRRESGLVQSGTATATFSNTATALNSAVEAGSDVIRVASITTSTPADQIIGPRATVGSAAGTQTDFSRYSSDCTHGYIVPATLTTSAETTWTPDEARAYALNSGYELGSTWRAGFQPNDDSAHHHRHHQEGEWPARHRNLRPFSHPRNRVPDAVPWRCGRWQYCDGRHCIHLGQRTGQCLRGRATFGGSGSAGNVTVVEGFLAPGGGADSSFAFASLTLDPAAKLVFGLDDSLLPVWNDMVQITNRLPLSGEINVTTQRGLRGITS